MHYFSVGCSFKNNTLHRLPEFLAYHAVIGASRFYLINGETDPTLGIELLRPYSGFVKHIHMPGVGLISNTHVHNTLTNSARGETRWLAYLDVDEFLMPMCKNSVVEVLEDYDDYSALYVNWQIFGSSGLISRPAWWTERFVHRSHVDFFVNRHVKCIGNPEKMHAFITPHYAPTTDGRSVNEFYQGVGGSHSEIHTSKIRLNHYVVGSLDDFKEDIALFGYKDWDFFNIHDRNEVFDDSIWVRFGEKVKEFHASIERCRPYCKSP